MCRPRKGEHPAPLWSQFGNTENQVETKVVRDLKEIIQQYELIPPKNS
jgi:hypothetical protein